jgi:hypothetical protein
MAGKLAAFFAIPMVYVGMYNIIGFFYTLAGIIKVSDTSQLVNAYLAVAKDYTAEGKPVAKTDLHGKS